MATALPGCATPARLPMPNAPEGSVAPVGFPASVRIVATDADTFRVQSREVIARLRQAAGGGEVNVLALSGGGAGGAFGAGVIVGLSDAGKRPSFQLVTGVSTGALIAPLAFLGSDWDDQLETAFAGQGAQQLLQRHLWGLVFGSSLYDGRRLQSLVDRFVTDELLRRVAAEARKGRMLLVETTDLDHEEPVIWDMGAIAMQGGAAARQLFRNVLVASSSIPTLFPPVLIRVEGGGMIADELHVDGSTTSSLFIAPEIASVVGDAFADTDHFNIYVIVNGQLGTSPKSTTLRTLGVLSRSVSANLRHSSRMAVALAFNIATSHGMIFNLTSIPDSYPFQGPLDFRSKSMKTLFAFARSCAAQGLIWKSVTDTYRIARREISDSIETTTPTCPALEVEK